MINMIFIEFSQNWSTYLILVCLPVRWPLSIKCSEIIHVMSLEMLNFYCEPYTFLHIFLIDLIFPLSWSFDFVIMLWYEINPCFLFFSSFFAGNSWLGEVFIVECVSYQWIKEEEKWKQCYSLKKIKLKSIHYKKSYLESPATEKWKAYVIVNKAFLFLWLKISIIGHTLKLSLYSW